MVLDFEDVDDSGECVVLFRRPSPPAILQPAANQVKPNLDKRSPMGNQGASSGRSRRPRRTPRGEVIELPRYPEIVRLNVGDVLDIDVTRDGATARISIPLTGETAPVPQWLKRLGFAT
jgi:hypothetical protein